MLRDRVRSAFLFGIPVLAMLLAGGPWMAVLVFIVGAMALIEFVHLVARKGHRAFGGLLVAAMVLFVADRVWPELQLLAPGLAVFLIAAMGWALVRFRQGTANAVTGFAMTLAGALYIGWSAAHFVGLRALPDGLFWTLSTVLAVWIADSAAYEFGRRIGRSPLVKDVSPNKTWEGYLSGIAASTIISGLLPLLWQALGASAAVKPEYGLALGALLSTVTLWATSASAW